MPDGGKGLGETPRPPGHPDTLTPGRADCVILKCFRLRPDGRVKQDHTRGQTRTRRHIQFGIQLPRTNNSCEPDALQSSSLKHMHTNGRCSHSLHVPPFGKVKDFCAWYQTLCCILALTSPWNLMLDNGKDNVSFQNYKGFVRNRFVIFTSSLFTSLSTKYTELPKWLYCLYDISHHWAEVQSQKRSQNMWPTQISLFLLAPPPRQTWRKNDSSSRLFKLFLWEQRKKVRL